MAVYTTHLCKVGTDVMLPIPGAMLEQLGLHLDDSVRMYIEDGRLVIDPTLKPRYTLDELLAASDPSRPLSAEEREWLASPPVGREML